MSRKFQLWFYLTIGIPYFIFAFLKISIYLIDVFIYKVEVFDTKGLMYVLVQFVFMIAAGFLIKLGVKEIRLKGKNGKEVTKK